MRNGDKQLVVFFYSLDAISENFWFGNIKWVVLKVILMREYFPRSIVFCTLSFGKILNYSKVEFTVSCEKRTTYHIIIKVLLYKRILFSRWFQKRERVHKFKDHFISYLTKSKVTVHVTSTILFFIEVEILRNTGKITFSYIHMHRIFWIWIRCVKIYLIFLRCYLIVVTIV